MIEQREVRREIPLSKLIAEFGPDLEMDRELASMNSYGTGGNARYLIAAGSAEEIVRAISSAKRLGLKYFLLGGGSNVLVSDDGYDGLVIKVDVRGIRLLEDNMVECGAGEQLMSLVEFAAENSLSGLEFAAGIWGTVGGAIFGNAGAFGGEIGGVLSDLTLVNPDGEVKTVSPDYCRFGYRDSNLKATHEIVVSARIALTPGERKAIRARIDEILAHRDTRHPNNGKSAGCFFKNIPDASQPHGKLPAGKLLEEIGAKGMQIGGARVFEKHANIIVNTGTATSKDIRRLADILKSKVFDRFGIELEEEVQFLGKF